MAEIAIIGLGLMGTALARAIRRKGHEVVVWNRSPEKMEALRIDGAACAKDLTAALDASPIALICINNYETTRSMLDTSDIGRALRGKVVVQLSSGTPKEAADAADWVHDHGAIYLDGAILAAPDDIGTAEATILLSGDQEAQDRAADLLACLGDGTVRYLGPNVRAASALDLAWLMSRYGTFIAAIHAANLCRSEGVAIDEFIALVPENPAIQRYATVIHEDSFDDFTASLRVWGEALEHVQQQGRDAGINTEIPDFISALFQRAIEGGLGESNVMSLIKVLEPKA